MSATTRWGPYETPAELARGRRTTILSLVVCLAAVVLSVLAARTVADDRLVGIYLVAVALHFLAAVGSAIRWSRTPDFGAAS